MVTPVTQPPRPETEVFKDERIQLAGLNVSSQATV